MFHCFILDLRYKQHLSSIPTVFPAIWPSNHFLSENAISTVGFFLHSNGSNAPYHQMKLYKMPYFYAKHIYLFNTLYLYFVWCLTRPLHGNGFDANVAGEYYIIWLFRFQRLHFETKKKEQKDWSSCEYHFVPLWVASSSRFIPSSFSFQRCTTRD